MYCVGKVYSLVFVLQLEGVVSGGRGGTGCIGNIERRALVGIMWGILKASSPTVVWRFVLLSWAMGYFPRKFGLTAIVLEIPSGLR